MRVALVHDWLVGMRGGEKCLEVFCELFPEADLFTLVYRADNLSPIIQRMSLRTSWINRLPFIKNTYRYYLPLFPRLVEGFDFRGYDLILSSSHCVAKGAYSPGSLHIAYVYAPMRYVWDMYEAYFGARGGYLQKAGMSLFRRYLQGWDLRSSARVDHFIADSKNIGKKIQRLYGREATVIYPPVEIDKFAILPRQENFYLMVSALVPYKRIDIAIAAFNDLKLPLKIAGEGPMRKQLEKASGPNIEFLGWVNDRELAGLYGLCQALIFPGEEDFGIVPLEAQASGRPVIAYGKGGVLETVIPLESRGLQPNSQAGPTGLLFQEQSPESLIMAVERFDRQRDAFDPARLRRHAAGFSRERFRAQVKEFIENRLVQSQGRA